MRVPLSWLADFAPFQGSPSEIAAVLDDLGLVVEGVELVGEGLADVVVARVGSIDPIEGADKIRRIGVDDGNGPVEVVCGAWNFEVGDRVALAPVGAVLPGGVTIRRQKLKGVASNGMLCSAGELNLSDDHEGILILNDNDGATPGRRLTDVLSIEPDAVFDIAVEANRPDALSVAGVARDLAARLGLPFAFPVVPTVEGRRGLKVEEVASVEVTDRELCPRFNARVVTEVQLAPSPDWLARRLSMAGMRPINNVVDASNYVMLELGQPTHPYDLDRLAGAGLIVRRARPGETLVTLDGTERTLGQPGPGLDDTGQDCLICDAEGTPVGIAGIMGGSSSEIDDRTTRVLLETAYFAPMAVARTSKRLGLRTEASTRFERGCDPHGIDRAALRFCQLLALTGGEEMEVAEGSIDVRGELPAPVELTVRPASVNALLGTSLPADTMIDLLTPLGFVVEPAGAGEETGAGEEKGLRVVVPTFRPDIRPAPEGRADIAEEVARTYGYRRIVRRTPSWPQPGRLSPYQRDRRLIKDILCGLGCSEAWTATFVSESDQILSGFDPPYVEVTNPLVESERYLRGSMAPGLMRAVLYNNERRQGSIRLFEVGSVFRMVEDPPGDPEDGPPVDEPEHLSAVFALEGDDAWAAAAAWRTMAEGLRIEDWVMGDRPHLGPEPRVLHPYRSASVASVAVRQTDEGTAEHPTLVGVVGELDPYLVGQFRLVGPDGRPRRVGWLDLDLGVLLDRERVPRRSEESRPISRFPSSDIDLAFVVDEQVPAGSVARTLRTAGGDLLESVDLFDVYRGPSVDDGSRSLAFRLRFCAQDRTLTDDEVGDLRTRCVEAVASHHRARLR